MTNSTKGHIVRFLIILQCSLFIVHCSFGQGWKRYRKELSLSLGATNFLGELGGANTIGTHGILDFDAPSIRPAMNLGFSYKLSDRLTLKTNFTWGELYGNDAYTKELWRNHRNLMFRSSITQLHAQLEWYFIREKEGHKYNIYGVKGWKNMKISGYIFAGVGAFYFNPKAKYEGPTELIHGKTYNGNVYKGPTTDLSSDVGKWFALIPLHTEGEGVVLTRTNYSQIQPCLPLGVGFKYLIKGNLSLGLEYGLYLTYTDYIDDVSTTYFDPNYLANHYGALSWWFANPNKANWGTINASATAAGQQRGNPRQKDAYMFAFVSLYYTIPSGKFVIPLF